MLVPAIDSRHKSRDSAILSDYMEGLLTEEQIGVQYGLTASVISRIVYKQRDKLKIDADLERAKLLRSLNGLEEKTRGVLVKRDHLDVITAKQKLIDSMNVSSVMGSLNPVININITDSSSGAIGDNVKIIEHEAPAQQNVSRGTKLFKSNDSNKLEEVIEVERVGTNGEGETDVTPSPMSFYKYSTPPPKKQPLTKRRGGLRKGQVVPKIPGAANTLMSRKGVNHGLRAPKAIKPSTTETPDFGTT